MQPAEERCAQLVQRREQQFHLRLDADRAQDPEVRRRVCQVVEQRGLPDAGLAQYDQGAALTVA